MTLIVLSNFYNPVNRKPDITIILHFVLWLIFLSKIIFCCFCQKDKVCLIDKKTPQEDQLEIFRSHDRNYVSAMFFSGFSSGAQNLLLWLSKEMGKCRGIWVWKVQIWHLFLNKTIPTPCFGTFCSKKAKIRRKWQTAS